jgi:hypothetical protein
MDEASSLLLSLAALVPKVAATQALQKIETEPFFHQNKGGGANTFFP